MKLFGKFVLAIFLAGFLFAFIAFSRSIFLARTAPILKGLHYGINQTTEFFDEAYTNIYSKKPADKIAGITVNHHLLAPNLIAQEFALIATDEPVTVALISPNHFFRGSGGVISSNFDWQTPYGVLQTDQSLVAKLQATGLITLDETPFDQEHGINGIVGFIKRSMPNAKFVPLIVKDNLSDAKVDQIATELNNALPPDALIVGSLDFSHYLTSNGAQFHDAQTLAAINNFDYDRIKLLDIDSHPGLRLLLKYFDLRGNTKFVLTSHANSSIVTGNYTFVETTSYINGYFTAGTNPPNKTRTVLYVQGLSSGDHWQVNAADRLLKYNDSVTESKPTELNYLNLARKPLAVGLVYNQNLTDIYLFPLIASDHEIKLMPEPKPDTLHIQLSR